MMKETLTLEAEIPFEGTESAMFTTLYYRQKVKMDLNHNINRQT